MHFLSWIFSLKRQPQRFGAAFLFLKY